MQVLMTGFGPFGDVVDNPSARLVSHFARLRHPGLDLTTRVFRVTYAEVRRDLPSLLDQGRFDVVLLLGVASNSSVGKGPAPTRVA